MLRAPTARVEASSRSVLSFSSARQWADPGTTSAWRYRGVKAVEVKQWGQARRGIGFILYHATLLPDVDFGDTPSFQARIGVSLLTPRDAYPLYTAIGTAFHWIVRGTPAHALNLASAVEQVERDLIQAALDRAGGNISESARSLGLTRRGLYLKIRRLGLDARSEVDAH